MNQKHNVHHLTTLGDRNIKIHHDIPETGNKVSVDASAEAEKYKEINPKILKSRKQADAPEKARHKKMLDSVRSSLDKKLRAHMSTIKPKWGNETEGHVLHPSEHNPSAPRIKIVDPRFKQRKQERGRDYTK